MTEQKKLKKIKMWGLFADDELISIANKEIKIEVLDRNDFISEKLEVIPVEVIQVKVKKKIK